MHIVGLIQLAIEQENLLLLVRAHLVALERVTVEYAGRDIKQKLSQYTQEILASANFDATHRCSRDRYRS